MKINNLYKISQYFYVFKIQESAIYIFILLSCFYFQTLYSQELPDSIKIKFNKIPSDTAKIAYLNGCADWLISSDLQLASKIAEIAGQLADSCNFPDGKAHALLTIGMASCNLGNQSKALEKALEAQKIFESLHDTIGLIGVSKNLGIIYSYENNIKTAVYYFEEALAYSKKINNYQELGNCHNNLGVIYAQSGQFDLALKNHQAALKNYTLAKDITGIGKSHLNIGVLYRNMENYSTSNEYLLKSIPILNSIQFKRALSSAYCNLGINALMLGEKEKALNYQNQSLELAKELQDKQLIANGYYGLTTIYEKSGDYKQALLYNKLLNALEDSVLNQESSRQIAEMQTRFDTEKKDNEIKRLTQEKQIQDLTLKQQRLLLTTGAIIVALIIIFFIIFFRYRMFKEKQLRALTVTETEHKERLRIAKDMHDDLGSGLSKILILAELIRKNALNRGSDVEAIDKIAGSVRELSEKMSDLVWSLNPENSNLDNLVSRLREYISDFLEDSDIVYETDFPDNVDKLPLSKEAMRNIYLSFKEALNNTVKHSGGNYVKIYLSTNHKLLDIKISDNGKGFDPDHMQRQGNGLNNMKHRIEDIHGQFSLSSESEKGTSVSFRLPLKEIELKTL